MSMLYPHIFATKRIGKTFVAACVGGELHEIGIRMVSDFFEIEGWDTYYLGANTPADTILQAIDDNQAQLVGLSAAMPYHRKLIRETISKIRNSDTGKNVKIIIGGNAINIRKGQYDSFGADGFAPDAENATKIGAELTK